jgi:spermidine synthase
VHSMARAADPFWNRCAGTNTFYRFWAKREEMDLRFVLLLVCFFLSGFAALLYQTAWTREFAFLFGTSELAVVAVLAAYMGGLALGAAAAARFVGRLRRPVLAYGLLELGIAICALGVPLGIKVVQGIYLGLAGGLDAPPETMSLATALIHLVGAFLVLVPCTALMGATLPLLARYAVSEDAQVGPRIGVLYSINTLGAIGGTLVAAFVLLPELGLRHTVFVGIGANAVVFLAAAILARSMGSMERESPFVHPEMRAQFHWILPAMTVSGAVSFVYEVLWTRLLGQVLGGSTAAFASMLSSFLLGIALGSAIASRFAKTREAAALGFAVSQVGIGVLAWIAFRASDYLPDLAHAVGAHPAAPGPGAAAAGILLLPVTLCIGATFPFGVRLLARDAEEAGTVSGRVYAWNTLGSILGAVLAGFFLLPTLGLQNTALVGVLSSLALAAAAAWYSSPRRKVMAGAVLAVAVVAALVGLPVPDRLLMHSAISGTRIPGELFYLGVGRSATVTIVEKNDGWRLLTNGLPESGIDRAQFPNRRFNETAWLSLLPTAARPETDKMLIIGLGAGRTLEATAATVSHIDVIELEEEVVTANRIIPRAIDPLDDPRVHLRVGDARGAMTLSDATYDAIVSQPSHPWTSGASHLYTREFFDLVHSKLEPGGVFVQWIGAGFVDNELFGNLMASMTSTFRHVHVYRPVSAALVFMASDEPIDLSSTAPRALAASPEDFGRQGIHRVEDFYASWTLNTEGVRALASGRPPNTDDHNRLATRRLPPAQSEGRVRMGALDASFASQDPLDAEALTAGDPVAVLRRMNWVGQPARVKRLVESLELEADRSAANGWLFVDQSRSRAAVASFVRAIEADPTHSAARAGLVAVGPLEQAASLERNDAEEAVFQTRVAQSQNQDTPSMSDLDLQLARIVPGDHLFGTATRARATWRIRSGDPDLGREAISIVDELLTRERGLLNYLLRAEAAEVAKDSEIAWATLEAVVSRGQIPPSVARQAIQIVARLGRAPEGSTVVPRLQQAARNRR